MTDITFQQDMRVRVVFALIGAILVPGCMGGSQPTDPTADPIEIEGAVLVPRAQESLEFSGRLPVTFRGLHATSGTSNFSADFGRSGNWTTIEITISAERVKAPGYIVSVSAEEREGSTEFDGTEPYVVHTDLRGPYEVFIRANGPDIEGTLWKANVTQYFRD